MNVLQACLNGSRTAEEHPALPLTPERLAEDAADAAALGVTSVHIHPRDVIGAPTLVGPEVATTIATVRAAVPGIEISVSTNVPGNRMLIASWAPLAAGRPDIASVHVGQPGWWELAETLHRVNVGVELVVDAAAQLGELPPGTTRITVTATAETAEQLLDSWNRSACRSCCTAGTTAPGRCSSTRPGSNTACAWAWRTRWKPAGGRPGTTPN